MPDILSMAYDWGRRAANERQKGNEDYYLAAFRAIVRRGDRALAAEWERGYQSIIAPRERLSA